MFTVLANAVRRANRRSQSRRAYRFLSGQSDAMLKDIGLSRDGLYHAVVHGRDRG